MARCNQATSHYLSQCWPRSMSPPYGITRLQWVQLGWAITFPTHCWRANVSQSTLAQISPAASDQWTTQHGSLVSTDFIWNSKRGEPKARRNIHAASQYNWNEWQAVSYTKYPKHSRTTKESIGNQSLHYSFVLTSSMIFNTHYRNCNTIGMLTLLMLEMEYSGSGGQYHACWCLGSLSRLGSAGMV